MNFTDEQYQEYVSSLRTGYAAANLCKLHLDTAENILKKIGGFKLEQKMYANKAKYNVEKLAEFSSKNVKNTRGEFFDRVYALDDIIEKIVMSVQTKEQEELLINFLDNLQ